METDAAAMTTAAPCSAETVTKDTFDATKKLADDKIAENASLKARLDAFEARERAKLAAFSATNTQLMEELMNDAVAEDKSEFKTMVDWAREAHDRQNLEAQAPLVKVVAACASKLKRVREEASVQSATADQLASALKQNERDAEEKRQLSQRVGELSTALEEMTRNSEKLQQQLAAGMAAHEAQKYDFSKASSREAQPPADAAKNEPTGAAVVTENASKSLAPLVANPADALLAFVTAHDSGRNGNRFMPSATNHSLLGAGGDGTDIASALRTAAVVR